MAIRFNGVDTGYQSSGTDADITGDYTIAIWAKPPSGGAFLDDTRFLVLRDDSVETFSTQFSAGREVGHFSAFVRDGADFDSKDLVEFPDPQNNDWRLYVIRKDSNTKQYITVAKNDSIMLGDVVNGANNITRSGLTDYPATSVGFTYELSNPETPTNHSDGDWGGLAIWDVPLTDAELESIASGDVFTSIQVANLLDSFYDPDADSVLVNEVADGGDLEVLGSPTTVDGPFSATLEPQGTVTLDAPENNSEQTRPNISLAWSYDDSDHDSFDVQVARDSGFAVLQVDANTLASPFDTSFELDNDLTYHWRVRARNSGGVSAWSDARMFNTETSPLQVARVNAGEAVLTLSDITINTGWFYFRPYKAADFPEVETFGARYFGIWSTDHDSGAGGLWWGTFDSLDLSDFVERGKIIDGDETPDATQTETPFLVRNPSDPNGLTLYLYEHSEVGDGDQETRLMRSPGGVLHEVQWILDGTVMPANEDEAGNHTGYRTVIRRGINSWFAWGLTRGGSNPRYDLRISDDGFSWSYVTDLNVQDQVPQGRRVNAAQFMRIGEIDGSVYHLSYMVNEDQFGLGSGDAQVIMVRVDNDSQIVGPHYILIDTLYDQQGAESDNIRTVACLLDDDGRLHLYYQTDNNLFYATSDINAVTVDTLPTLSRTLQGAPDATNLRFAIHDRATPSPYIIESGTDGVVSAEVFERSVGAGLKPGDAAYVVVTDTDGNPASETNAFAGPMGVE